MCRNFREITQLNKSYLCLYPSSVVMYISTCWENQLETYISRNWLVWLRDVIPLRLVFLPRLCYHHFRASIILFWPSSCTFMNAWALGTFVMTVCMNACWCTCLHACVGVYPLSEDCLILLYALFAVKEKNLSRIIFFTYLVCLYMYICLYGYGNVWGLDFVDLRVVIARYRSLQRQLNNPKSIIVMNKCSNFSEHLHRY